MHSDVERIRIGFLSVAKRCCEMRGQRRVVFACNNCRYRIHGCACWTSRLEAIEVGEEVLRRGTFWAMRMVCGKRRTEIMWSESVVIGADAGEAGE